MTLAGQDFVLRPDFDAVMAIDEALNGVVALTRRAVADPASLTLTELAVVITEGIKAHGRSTGSVNAGAGTDKVKRMIFEAGIPSVIAPVIKFLTAAVTGGADAGNE